MSTELSSCFLFPARSHALKPRQGRCVCVSSNPPFESSRGFDQVAEHSSEVMTSRITSRKLARSALSRALSAVRRWNSGPKRSSLTTGITVPCTESPAAEGAGWRWRCVRGRHTRSESAPSAWSCAGVVWSMPSRRRRITGTRDTYATPTVTCFLSLSRVGSLFGVFTRSTACCCFCATDVSAALYASLKNIRVAVSLAVWVVLFLFERKENGTIFLLLILRTIYL